MNRRQALAALAALAALPPRAAEPPRIAVLASGTPEQFATRFAALKKALPAQWTLHAAGGDLTRLTALARAAVAEAPQVLVADSMLGARLLFEATPTIPIVMARSENPVAARLVRSLEQPGGNVTGVVTGRPDEVIKAAGYLGRLLPAGAPLAALLNPNAQTYRAVRARVNYAAQQQKRAQVFIDASVPGEIERAFAQLAAEKGAGLVVMDDALFLDEAARIVKLAAQAKRPAIYPDRLFVAAGGLMSYGPDALEAMALAAAQVRKLLAGAKAAELAMVEVPPFKLALNQAAFKAQGYKPPSV